MKCTEQTKKNTRIKDHIYYNNGSIKSVCVSTCLSFFGVSPDSYHYTSSKINRQAYESVLRRFGFSVRSRASEFRITKMKTTTTQLKSAIKKSSYTEKDFFIADCVQRTTAHLIVINGLGETIIDTAPKMRWKILAVKQIF